MRHRKAGKKLGMNTAHREATRRNMIVSLFRHERIVTTLEKAKGFRPRAEKLITLGKERTLARYRRALSELQDKTVVRKLFTELADRYRDRPGGYTRILRLQNRRIGDGASQAILELVDNKVLEQQIAKAETEAAEKETQKGRPKKGGKKGAAKSHEGHEHEHEHEGEAKDEGREEKEEKPRRQPKGKKKKSESED
jgi:large subunit ribosomal protein L17